MCSYAFIIVSQVQSWGTCGSGEPGSTCVLQQKRTDSWFINGAGLAVESEISAGGLPQAEGSGKEIRGKDEEYAPSVFNQGFSLSQENWWEKFSS